MQPEYKIGATFKVAKLSFVFAGCISDLNYVGDKLSLITFRTYILMSYKQYLDDGNNILLLAIHCMIS